MSFKEAPLDIDVDMEGEVVDYAGNPFGWHGRFLTGIYCSLIKLAELQHQIHFVRTIDLFNRAARDRVGMGLQFCVKASELLALSVYRLVMHGDESRSVVELHNMGEHYKEGLDLLIFAANSNFKNHLGQGCLVHAVDYREVCDEEIQHHGPLCNWPKLLTSHTDLPISFVCTSQLFCDFCSCGFGDCKNLDQLCIVE